jgi:hypothetical protein
LPHLREKRMISCPPMPGKKHDNSYDFASTFFEKPLWHPFLGSQKGPQKVSESAQGVMPCAGLKTTRKKSSYCSFLEILESRMVSSTKMLQKHDKNINISCISSPFSTTFHRFSQDTTLILEKFTFGLHCRICVEEAYDFRLKLHIICVSAIF